MWRDAPVGAGMTINWQDFLATFDFEIFFFFKGCLQTHPFTIDHFCLNQEILIFLGFVQVGGSGPAVVMDPP
jgi:hypothetical protein